MGKWLQVCIYMWMGTVCLFVYVQYLLLIVSISSKNCVLVANVIGAQKHGLTNRHEPGVNSTATSFKQKIALALHQIGRAHV